MPVLLSCRNCELHVNILLWFGRDTLRISGKSSQVKTKLYEMKIFSRKIRYLWTYTSLLAGAKRVFMYFCSTNYWIFDKFALEKRFSHTLGGVTARHPHSGFTSLVSLLNIVLSITRFSWSVRTQNLLINWTVNYSKFWTTSRILLLCTFICPRVCTLPKNVFVSLLIFYYTNFTYYSAVA
jgi:hypothetical protein